MLYGWKNDQEKLFLGQGDEILNKFRWWICIAYGGTDGADRKYLRSRYCFSDLLMGNLIDEIVKHHKSPAEWCKAQVSKYVEYARQIWICGGEKYHNLNKVTMAEEIATYFHVDTIKSIIAEIGIGYIKQCNEESDKLLYQDHWITEYHIDASHQTQSNIVYRPKSDGTSKKCNTTYVLKATESRVTNNMGLNIGDTYLLENGAESHGLIFGEQLSSIVSGNMNYIKHSPKIGFAIHAQNDTATHNNVENVRNIFLQGIQKQLSLKPDQSQYTNMNGIQFKLNELKFMLSQESMHLYHRLMNLGAFKHGHPDTGYMRKDCKAFVRNIRLQYDIFESPFILYTVTTDHKKYLTPYELIEYCSIFKNPQYDYVVSRAIRALWMRKGTRKENHRKELRSYMSKKKTFGLGVDVIRHELKYVIKHTPPYLLNSFFSVKSFFIYIYIYIYNVLFLKFDTLV